MDEDPGTEHAVAGGSRAHSELDALNAVITALERQDEDARRRIIQYAAAYLHIGSSQGSGLLASPEPRPVLELNAKRVPYSEDSRMPAKEFLHEKEPRTDVERIACLAYYLTHYRSTPHFKTVDLSFLNTEAAQPKFSNAANAANNAVTLGYLVPSGKGLRQISAAGERFVGALPDRDLAKAALENVRRKNRTRRSRAKAGEKDV